MLAIFHITVSAAALRALIKCERRVSALVSCDFGSAVVTIQCNDQDAPQGDQKVAGVAKGNPERLHLAVLASCSKYLGYGVAVRNRFTIPLVARTALTFVAAHASTGVVSFAGRGGIGRE
jgi:hypothetical protein